MFRSLLMSFCVLLALVGTSSVRAQAPTNQNSASGTTATATPQNAANAAAPLQAPTTADAAKPITIGDELLALIVAGLLGMVGQGVRAVGGIKKMVDEAQAKGVSPSEAFSPGWFVVTLMIGFIAGVIAGLTLGIAKLLKTPDDNQILLGIAAAGYAGTDFIEAFASRLSSGLMPKSLPAGDAGGGMQQAARRGQSFPA